MEGLERRKGDVGWGHSVHCIVGCWASDATRRNLLSCFSSSSSSSYSLLFFLFSSTVLLPPLIILLFVLLHATISHPFPPPPPIRSYPADGCADCFHNPFSPPVPRREKKGQCPHYISRYSIDGRTDRQRKGLIDGWMVWWMDRWVVDRRLDGCVKWIEGRIDWWLDLLIQGWMDGSMERGTAGWMPWWIFRWIKGYFPFYCSSICSSNHLVPTDIQWCRWPMAIFINTDWWNVRHSWMEE